MKKQYSLIILSFLCFNYLFAQNDISSDLFIGANRDDWDSTLYKNGIYRKWGGDNSPFGGSHSTLLSIGQDSGGSYGFQLSSDNNKRLKYRGFTVNGVFNEWFDIFHSGNFNKNLLEAYVPNIVYRNIDNDFDSDQTIKGDLKLDTSGNKIYWDWESRAIEQYSSGGNNRMIRFMNSMDSSNIDGGFNFTDHNGNSVLRINQHKVGIGTDNLDAKLTVAGDIHSREVRVTINAGADFVFENDYKLLSLQNVEAYIKENKHLPEIASAKEMEAQGLKLAEMNVKLLQKIEELTLYTIEQEKKINKLEKDNIELKLISNKLSEIEKLIKKN